MRLLTRAALLGGGVSVLAMALPTAAAAEPSTQAAGAAGYSFDIPAKPLLAALADFTAVTGVQVVRPGAQKIAGRSRPVSGWRDAAAALGALLADSGLSYTFTGPRAVTLRRFEGEAVPVQLAGGTVALDELQATGEQARPGGGDGRIEIGPEELARKNPSDVRDVFAGEPGVQVGSSIPSSQKVYVRGVEETNLAVSIDGSAQNNKVFHHNATTLIDPNLLKAARVDAGVAPADAGFGALAGSIAYETKDVADLLERDGDGAGGFVKAWFNTNGSVFGTSTSGHGKQNGFEALGYLNFAKGDDFKAGNGDKVGGTETDLLSGIGKFAYESGEGHRFEFSHERVHDDATRPYRANAGNIALPRPEPELRDYKLDRQNTVFNYSDTSPEGWLDPKIVFAYSETKVKIPNFGGLTQVGSSTGSTSSLNGRAENRFAFALGEVTAGLDFRHDRAKVRYGILEGLALPADYPPGEERMTNVGLYAQARLEPFDRARLSFGARGDHQWFEGANDTDGSDIDHAGFSGNVSGEYDLIPEWLTAKAGYSHVWAGIPLAENFILNPAWNYAGGTGGDLSATTSDNYTAGLVARHAGFTLEGSVFKTQIENARNARFRDSYFPPYGGNPVPGVSWAPDLDTKGFEIGAGYAWDAGFVRVKYAHIDVDIDGRTADSDTGNYIATPVGDIITVTAAHTFVAWNVTVGGDIELSPRYTRTAVDPFSATGDKYPAYPAYEIVNAFVEYKPTLKYETTLRIDVKNIFDETYSSRATYGSEFGTVTPLYEPGRSVLMSALVKF